MLPRIQRLIHCLVSNVGFSAGLWTSPPSPGHLRTVSMSARLSTSMIYFRETLLVTDSCCYNSAPTYVPHIQMDSFVDDPNNASTSLPEMATKKCRNPHATRSRWLKYPQAAEKITASKYLRHIFLLTALSTSPAISKVSYGCIRFYYVPCGLASHFPLCSHHSYYRNLLPFHPQDST